MNVKVGLIQMSLKGQTGDSPDSLRASMLAAHIDLIERAAPQAIQVLGMQELFNQPYFCPVQDEKWFAAAEAVPDGPTTQALAKIARKHSMVIVAPVYERDGDRRFNTAIFLDADGTYLGKYRKIHIPDMPQGRERFYFDEGDLGYPVFQTAYCKVGACICYDRHFPEAWRALALNGAELVFNPSATPTSTSRKIWELEQPAAAVANGIFIAAINRVGIEAPWLSNRFYGSSYVVDPQGTILAQAASDHDELLVVDIDLAIIKSENEKWQFFERRRPETYKQLSDQGRFE